VQSLKFNKITYSGDYDEGWREIVLKSPINVILNKSAKNRGWKC